MAGKRGMEVMGLNNSHVEMLGKCKGCINGHIPSLMQASKAASSLGSYLPLYRLDLSQPELFCKQMKFN